METRLEMLGQRLFKHVQVIQQSWFDIFGKNFEQYYKGSSLAIKTIVDKTKDRLNLGGKRTGEATLFFRDPLSDRLKLVYSTNNDLNPESIIPNYFYFSDRNSNYDDRFHTCYYKLCDRLTPDQEKYSDKSREARGLTGWVAVTGHPLRVNSERSKSRLEDIIHDHPETDNMCKRYGTPFWGNHIAEFAIDDRKKFNKRFLAVPIKSFGKSNVTIGVLRYTCLMKGDVLDHIDVYFLESMAELISAIKNLERVQTITIRKENFPLAVKNFEDSGYIDDFLEFIAKSLNSKIVSLYIYLKCDNRYILRLFDAYGISGSTGNLRRDGRIKDYSDQQLDKRGLTLDIFNSKSDRPTIFKSVINAENWQGINTEIFYKEPLLNLGIPNDITSQLGDATRRRSLLETYSIKLMGIKLIENGNPLGVLKVEFPSNFDSDHYYENDDDMAFFNNCANVLSKELLKYQLFIQGDWFAKDSESKIKDFIKLVGQIMRIRLLEGCKEIENEFIINIKNYSTIHKNEIYIANDEIFDKLPMDKNKSIYKKIWENAPPWVKEALLSSTLNRIIDSLI